MAALQFQKGFDSLRKIFSDNLSVQLLAEKIVTCSEKNDAKNVKFEMEELDFDYFGVESDEKIIGYVARSELSDGPIFQYIHYFKVGDLVSDSTSLIDLLKILKDKNPVFVLEQNQVNRIITVADLQKQPIRLLVFGLISLLEMNLLEMIKGYYDMDEWKRCLSEERLAIALGEQEKRKNKNEGLDLIECLQLSDKGTILRKTPYLSKKLDFRSNSDVKRFFKSIETLRNNTAHSQEYSADDFNDFLNNIIRVEEIIALF